MLLPFPLVDAARKLSIVLHKDSKMGFTLPLIKSFRATNYVNAFILNALATATIAVLAVVFNDVLGKYEKELSVGLKRFIAFLCTVIAAVLTYLVLYLLFEYGGGFFINGA